MKNELIIPYLKGRLQGCKDFLKGVTDEEIKRYKTYQKAKNTIEVLTEVLKDIEPDETNK